METASTGHVHYIGYFRYELKVASARLLATFCLAPGAATCMTVAYVSSDRVGVPTAC